MGSVTRNPAIGPAAPMSMSARRVLGRLRRRMTAPSVPMSERMGAGMKKGQVASTPCFRARTKCPISWASRMAMRAAENASPWRTSSGPVGGGSCVSPRKAPARNAEAAVRAKSAMLIAGGRSPPSVPGRTPESTGCCGSWPPPVAGRAGSSVNGVSLKRPPSLAGLRLRRRRRGGGGGGRWLRHRRGYRRRPFRIELLDGAAVEPQPEQLLLRLAVLAEDGIARRPFEGLLHRGECVAHRLARLGAFPVEDAPHDHRGVPGMGFEKAGPAMVGPVEVVHELAGRRPLAVGEEPVREDGALHVAGGTHPLVDQLRVVPEAGPEELHGVYVLALGRLLEDLQLALVAAARDHVLGGHGRRDEPHGPGGIGNEERIEVDDGRALALQACDLLAAPVRVLNRFDDLLRLLHELLALVEVLLRAPHHA